MVVWILLIIFLIFLNIVIANSSFKDKKKAYLIISSVVTIFLIGSRSFTYPKIGDLIIYSKYFESTFYVPWSKILTLPHYNFEIGYVFLNKFVSFFIKWPQMINYVVATIYVIFIAIFIYKNSDNPMDSMIIFISFGLLKFMLTGYRQSIAMCICIFSIDFIKKRKLIPFIITILIAMLFHKTALVFFIAYPLLNREITKKNIITTIFASIITLLLSKYIIDFGNSLFNRNYSNLSKTEFSGIGFVFTFLIIILMSTLFKSKDENAKIGINMSIISFVVFLMGYIVTVVQRISWYFYFGPMIAIPNLYPKTFKDNLLCRILLIALSLVLLYHRFNVDDYRNYVFFWE